MTPITVDREDLNTETTGNEYDLWEHVAYYAPGFRAAIGRELDRLATLQPNWDAEGADRIDAKIVQAARQFAQSLPGNIVCPPAVVPMAKGNLQFEWHDGSRSLELEIENPTTIHYLKWDSAERVEEEAFFDIHDISLAKRLLRWFMGGGANV